MNANRWWLLAIVLLIIAVILGGRFFLAGETVVAEAAAPVASSQRPAEALPLSTAPDAVATPELTGNDSPLPELPESTVDAAVSMQQALAKGDPSAPPVQREAPREAPSAAELADPKAYQAYEARQNQRLYNQYLKAADSEIPRLQADIERARAAGLSPEQIAEGEEKLRRIQAMRDQLQAEKGATPAP